MIELNLLERKQPIRLPSVLGMDLNDLNFKMLFIALIIYYVPDFVFHQKYDSQLENEQKNLEQTNTEVTKINSELEKNKNVKEQLEAYTNQVVKLKARSAQVDEILKIRTNPKKILEKIARSIPEDLWFDQLKISENKDILINGGAYTPRSIGEFITVMNDSPFFGNSITPAKQETKQENLDGSLMSFEIFELKGKIKNYDLISR